MIHVRKVYPGAFRAMKRGTRVHDFFRDPGIAEGDQIHYREWDSGEDQFTGDELLVAVTSITRGPDSDVPRGYVAVSVAPVRLPAHLPGDLAEQRRRRDGIGSEGL